MSASDGLKRLISTAAVVGCLACADARLDPNMFDAVRLVAQSVRADVNANGGGDSARVAERLRVFEAEIFAMEKRVSGRQARAVFNAYAGAAEAYRYWLRFRDLDTDAVGEMVLLRGSNRPIAFRYGIPIEERGGGRWVSRRIAMRMFAAKADAELNDAIRLAGGE